MIKDEIQAKKILTDEEILAKQAELADREQKVEEKEKELNLLEAAVTGAKYNIYDKINVSAKTLDVFIGIVFVALIVVIVMAIVIK